MPSFAGFMPSLEHSPTQIQTASSFSCSRKAIVGDQRSAATRKIIWRKSMALIAVKPQSGAANSGPDRSRASPTASRKRIPSSVICPR